MISDQAVHKTAPTGWLMRAVLLLNISLGLSYIGLWFMLAQQDMFWRADFSAYYTGWAIIRDGQGEHLYDFDLQTRYQQEILEGRSFSDGLLTYNYPPHATLPFVPLALLPRQTAFWVWSLGQVALLIWLMRLLQRISRDWKPHERWQLFGAVAAFPPLLFTFQLGTFSLLMLVCTVQFYLALKHRHDRWAGWWLILGTVKFQLMVLPGFLLLGARRWQAILSAVLTGIAMIVVSSAFLGWRTWLDFINAVRSVGDTFGSLGTVPTVMYNLKGTLTLLLGNGQGQLINAISVVAILATIVLTLLLWRGPWKPDHASFELRMALTLLLGLLFNFHLNPHDGLLMVMPAILFYAYLRQRDLPRRTYAAFILSCPLLFLVSEFTIKGDLGIRIPTLMMVVLAIWMGKALADERRAGKLA